MTVDVTHCPLNVDVTGKFVENMPSVARLKKFGTIIVDKPAKCRKKG